jgi:UDP-N-acetylmuramate--alanine ligase
MITSALRGAGLDPGYLIGGTLRETGRNGEWGTGEWLVVEADESDRSMLALTVGIAVLTSVELDHHATFGSRLELEAAYRDFLAGAPEAVVWDRPDLLTLRAGPVAAYDVVAPDLAHGGSRFTSLNVDLSLRVPGIHNARNAVAALEVCRLVGADLDRAAVALGAFTGVARRFELLGHTRSGAAVYDDYAHHPTEVAATIAAARTLDPGRVIAVFQPHLYSRTQQLARAFGEALAGADAVVVLDVYPAREQAEDFPGVTGRMVAAAPADAADGRPVYWLPGAGTPERVLGGLLRAGDLCLVLGAGDVDALGRRLIG